MNQDEKKLAEKLRKVLAPHGHFQRIEPFNDKGIPDVNYCNRHGMEFWLELKAAANKNFSVRIGKEQFAWGQKRAALGGKVRVVAGLRDDPSFVVVHRFPFLKDEVRVGSAGIVVKSIGRPYDALPIKHLPDIL